MNYHNIVHDDMRNGTGLRVTLFVSGCENKCEGCQNPQTWDINSGIPFDDAAAQEIFDALDKPYIDGLTISGGDPLHPGNVWDVINLCMNVKQRHPEKTIWVYTGYVFEAVSLGRGVFNWIDVLVDGKFDSSKSDVKYHWAGSRNQRVIDVKKTLEQHRIVILDEEKEEDNVQDQQWEKPTMEEFKAAAKPMVDFIQKYFHPHAHVIITADGAELSEGTMATPFEVND